jgi:transposase-like protein
VAEAERDAGGRLDGLTSEERQELNRLRRENRVLREKRKILSKAAAWFATVPISSGLRGRESPNTWRNWSAST